MNKNDTYRGFGTQIYKNKMIELYGVENPSQSLEMHKKQHSGYILKHHDSGLYYRGSYEKDFIDFCLSNNIKIENFSTAIWYIFEDKKRKYFPDFYFKELNLVIEIKSYYTYIVEKNRMMQKKKPLLLMASISFLL